MPHTFYFKSTDSPTQYNIAKALNQLGYPQAQTTDADFSDLNLTLDDAYCQQLEFKHLLANLLSQHCPEITPPTYPINETNHQQVIANLKQENNSGWILKPALLNNGEGIKLFNTLDEVQTHYASTQRFAGEHVLQRYITQPHLLNGHKYTFRLFVVITHNGDAFLYPQGYFNVCRQPYVASDFNQPNSHLTNEHLNIDGTPNNWQIPTSKCPNFETIYLKLKRVITQTVQALNSQAMLNNNHPAFSLFGFDLMLDANLKAWLIEVNHGPCFPKGDEHPLQTHLYQDFWAHLVSEFVTPIMQAQPEKVTFQPTYFDHLNTK